MIGVLASRHKYGNKHWFPNVINTWQEIWSQRYDYTFTHTEVVPLLVLFGFFTFCDLLTSCQRILYGVRQKYWTQPRRPTASTAGGRVPSLRGAITTSDINSYLLSPDIPYLLIVKLPTVLVPVTLEVPCAVKLVDMWDCVL